jgi:hypothetical protein
MQQKTLLLILISLLFLTNSYAINKQDSIYHDLYMFLVSQGDMSKEQIPEFGCNNYGDI